MNETLLKQLVATKGWQEFLEIVKDEITESKLPKSYLTGGKTTDIIALECMAREKASKIIEKCIAKVNRIAGKREMNKESYE